MSRVDRFNELPIPEANDSASIGSDPQAAVATLDQRIDRVIREPLRLGAALHGTRQDPTQTAAFRPRPHATIAGFQESANSVDRKPLSPREREKPCVAKPDETTSRANPEASLMILEHGPDAGTGQAVGNSHRLDACPAPARQPTIGSDPETSVAVAAQRADEIARQPIPCRQRTHDRAIARRCKTTAVRADPQRAIPIEKESASDVVGKAFARRDSLVRRSDAPVDDTSAVRGNPETAVSILRHRPDAVARQPVASREPRHLLAVDADDATPGCGDVDRSVRGRMKLPDAVRPEHFRVECLDAAIPQTRGTSAGGSDPQRPVP